MTTASEMRTVRAGGVITVKRLMFVAVGLLALYTIAEHEPPLLNAANPARVHIEPFKWWLAPHIVAAAVALVSGPWQFSGTLRRRWPAFHRWMGRTYLVSLLIAGSLALYIGVRFERPENRWLMGSMAGLWLLTTVCGWLAIRNRQISQHQLWMTRSYLLTLTFITTRFIPDVVLPHMGYAGVTALYWVLVVFSLLAPDVLVNGRALRPWVQTSRRTQL